MVDKLNGLGGISTEALADARAAMAAANADIFTPPAKRPLIDSEATGGQEVSADEVVPDGAQPSRTDSELGYASLASYQEAA